MIKIKLYLIIAINLIALNSRGANLLVEAESFENKGGWVVDAQFVFEMGSPYLMAHGLGQPVKNATTKISFPEKGKYHIWVRTKNWVPGKWSAPGMFHLIINNKEFVKNLGTDSGWSWQYVGTYKVKQLKAVVELKDLTGFDGRCDAIYFSTDKQSPPNDKTKLEQWRNAKSYNPSQPVEEMHFDFVVVGGGIAGCAAAIAAAEQGLNVALIQDRPVLGGNASSEIRVHTLGITWKYDRILSKINTGHWENMSVDSKKDDEKRMTSIRSYKNIHLFLNEKAYQVKEDANEIKWIDAQNVNTSKRTRFSAEVFADCTGDGWIGYWAGADYMYGRETEDVFNENYNDIKGHIKSHFPFEKEKVGFDIGKLIIPATKDAKVMGASVMWYSKDADEPSSFPEVPWAMPIARKYAALNGEWNWEYSSDTLNQINNAEEIRDNMLRAIFGSFSNAKKDKANRFKKLDWVAYVLGKRESRRLVGDYIFTLNDERLHTKLADAVAKGVRDVDIHTQLNEINTTNPQFLSDALYYKTNEYYIPYRSLYSKNIKNLFMAGRDFSCSHLGLGGPRVMNTLGQMGCAVGYAASLCVQNKVHPREIYTEYLPQLLELIEKSNDVSKE